MKKTLYRNVLGYEEPTEHRARLHVGLEARRSPSPHPAIGINGNKLETGHVLYIDFVGWNQRTLATRALQGKQEIRKILPVA